MLFNIFRLNTVKSPRVNKRIIVRPPQLCLISLQTRMKRHSFRHYSWKTKCVSVLKSYSVYSDLLKTIKNQLKILISNIVKNFKAKQGNNCIVAVFARRTYNDRKAEIRCNCANSPRFEHDFQISHHLSTPYVVAFVYYLLMFPQLQSTLFSSVCWIEIIGLASGETTQCFDEFVIVFAEISYSID